MFLINSAWAQSGGGGDPIGLLLPFVLIFVVIYFLMIRPQQKRHKEHQAKLSMISKGDKIITAGGIFGKVIKAADDKPELTVEIAKGVEVQVSRQMIADVIDPKAGPPEKPKGLLASMMGGSADAKASNDNKKGGKG